MKALFAKLDKLKPIYDTFYKATMTVCKLLLITEIIVSVFVVGGRLLINKSPVWGEEIILTCMIYMALLSAAMGLRRGAHIRMTAQDKLLPRNVVRVLDLLADAAVIVFAGMMLFVGAKYAVSIGSKGFYTSLPRLSRFWLYLPVPVAGLAMIVFELELIYQHIKVFFTDGDEEVPE